MIKKQDTAEIMDSGAGEAVSKAESGTAKKGRRRRSVLRAEKKAIIILSVAVVLLIAALIVVKYIVGITVFTDLDGEKYYIKKVAGKYGLCDRDGNLLEQTVDGYYVTTKLSTLVEVKEDTGEYEIIAVVDTVEGESLGANRRLLMFNHTSQDNTQSIEVHNSYGSFTFYRDADDKFQIKGHEGVPYVPTMFSSLAVSCGYTLTMQKIEDPIKDANGNYTEYGLAPEKRIDDEGNEYDYEPCWYRLTDINGNSYTVYVGDAIPSRAGYYVKLTTRDAVYIMNYSADSSMLSMYDTSTTYESVENIIDLPVERFVSAVVCYPMSLNSYFDVQNFSVFRRDELNKADADENYDLHPLVSFSFWDMDSRFGTFYHSRSYNLNWPEDYLVNTTAADGAAQSFYSMGFLGVRRLGITEEDLKEFGLDDPAYIIYFKFKDIDHYISVSDVTPRGTYYMTSAIYDMIVEVDRTKLLFLDYRLIDWVDKSYFDMNIAWLKELTVEAGGNTYTFHADNSLSDSMSNPTYSDEAKKNTTISSAMMTMWCEDSLGNRMQALSSYSITDASGVTWTVTADKVTVVDRNGNRINSIKGAKYETNALGNEVVVLVGTVTGTDGTVISVDANTLLVTDPQGHTEKYLRYGMSTFRKFYQSLLYASLEGDVHDGMTGISDEKIAELTSDPESCQVKITIKTTYDKEPEYVYRYYPYSGRRSMITVNGGSGEFSVLRSFTNKIVSDAARVITGRAVDSTSKY